MKKLLMTGVMAITAAAMLTAGQQGAAAPAQPAQAGASAQAAPKQRTVKTKEEAQALQAVLAAATPDARITACEEFVTKYPKSDFAALALFAEAQSYQQKNDFEKMVVFGERVLENDPDDGTKLQTLLMLAKGIAQRTREFDLDREEKLGRVEKYVASALDMLKTMQKPNPQLPDEQWETVKASMAADAHDSLGIDALVRKNYDKAIAEFKMAVEGTKDPDPAAQVRLAAAYNKAAKYDDAIAICDKLMADANLHPVIRQAAQAERARAVQAKGGGAQAAPAPAAGTPAPQGGAAPAPAPAPAPKP